MRRLLETCRKYFRRFRYVIELEGSPYLVRYRLITTRWGSVYLHHILRPDADRELHDHPFDFTTLILWGGYHEEVFRSQQPGDIPQDMVRCTRWRGPGTIVKHKGTDFHRVAPKTTAWTLFCIGPKWREWGFMTDNGWVPHYQYFERKQHDNVDRESAEVFSGDSC